MLLSDFDFSLPQELIAQHPAKPADHCRLFVGKIPPSTSVHARFFDLPSFLRKGDVLVFNNTKVFPARLSARKKTGGAVEVLLLQQKTNTRWEALLGGAKRSLSDVLELDGGVSLRILQQHENVFEVEFSGTSDVFAFADRHGSVPTPPYIRAMAQPSEYQTLYARHVGSVAAPTAGLHFTERTFHDLREAGVQCEYITLHVGLGTFQPMTHENIHEHVMHSEWASVSETTAHAINSALREKRRVIPVGTTSLRTLEAFADAEGRIHHGEQWVNIFITPGYRFRVASGLITNFHTPKSTLLLLVSALVGRENMLAFYDIAIQKKYRFFSFGDAMLLWRGKP